MKKQETSKKESDTLMDVEVGEFKTANAKKKFKTQRERERMSNREKPPTAITSLRLVWRKRGVWKECEYWSFRALLPNSHASSQVDEYQKRIRKTGETAYLPSQLSVHLRVRITLELRKIYPERIEYFNSIMLSGIRLCFPLWVAQMSPSSVFHEIMFFLLSLT